MFKLNDKAIVYDRNNRNNRTYLKGQSGTDYESKYSEVMIVFEDDKYLRTKPYGYLTYSKKAKKFLRVSADVELLTHEQAENKKWLYYNRYKVTDSIPEDYEIVKQIYDILKAKKYIK